MNRARREDLAAEKTPDFAYRRGENPIRQRRWKRFVGAHDNVLVTVTIS